MSIQKTKSYLLLINYIGLIICLVALLTATSWTEAAAGTRGPSCRFGIGVTHTGGPMVQYDVGSLNVGWYWDWAARSQTEMAGLEYVRTVRLAPVGAGYTASPTAVAAAAMAAAQPGAVWFIGNEPDCIWQDNLRSEVYAQAYHDLYVAIKTADPTARIGVGGIVQPTPLRLAYLERVLAAYQAGHGAPLPTDIWVTHGYILCENCHPRQPGEPFAWGACPVPDWPNGAENATYYWVEDHWRIDIFTERLIRFRGWLNEHGYRDRPLWLSEYGILFYDGLIESKTMQDNIAFMDGVFDWLLTARDPVVGYPPDDNRLVQRWAWYSLDHDSWDMGGALFDFASHQPLELGQAYAAYTASRTPTARLQVQAWAEPTGELRTVRLRARVSNAGDLPTAGPVQVVIRSEEAGPALKTITLQPLAGCGGVAEVEAAWAELALGAHTFCVTAASADHTADVCDTVWIGRRTYLPFIGRSDSWRTHLPMLLR